jgi:hypothetical protein
VVRKADLVALAEDRLAPITWLPAFLRVEPVGEAKTASDRAVDRDEALAAE